MPNSLRIASCVLSTVFIFSWLPAFADGPQDNIPTKVRAVPPLGIELKADDQAELERGLATLEADIAELNKKNEVRTLQLLPDVEIFARAIRHGVQYRELFTHRDVDNAKLVLREGLSRAAALKSGQAPWTTQKGLVVRGFRSKIDRTVQPYGLVIPESYVETGKQTYRLDIWLHGRGESVSESVFIAERMKQVGRIAPQDTIVLHPYGRYSNAFKFAGEVDVLEALEHARKSYHVDEDRIAIRGFSMGGAGCWQFAVHYPDLFFAANPGAGFSETPEFLKSFQGETLTPTDYEKKLWQLYDCPPWAENLINIPTVAYSGELDSQKQAADIMEKTLAGRGFKLTHIVGPQTKHDIHPESAKIVEQKLEQLSKVGRKSVPFEVALYTPTLKYNRASWLTITRLREHWEPSFVRASIGQNEHSIELQVNNVRGLKLSIPAGQGPFTPYRNVKVAFTGPELNEMQIVDAGSLETDRSWNAEFYFDGKWKLGSPPISKLRKEHNLQGPIDDACMDSFIVVKPTGKARHAMVAQWTESELDHFVREWRRQFRGDAVVKKDTEITPEDIAANHLLLFGDPASNAVIASIMDRLPIQWTTDEVIVGPQKKYSSAEHAPILIYPNPANPKRYVVLNSGFTYREYAYLNNARQVPKLPDWAVIDLRTPPDSLWPGKVVAADFFNEEWQLKP